MWERKEWVKEKERDRNIMRERVCERNKNWKSRRMRERGEKDERDRKWRKREPNSKKPIQKSLLSTAWR